MKKSLWLLIAAMMATRVLAQTDTNVPAPAPGAIPAPGAETPNPATAPGTNPANAKKPTAKKRAIRKPAPHKNESAAQLKSVPLVPGPAVVVVNHLNVRGQAKLTSEVVGHLTKDAVVTVLEEVTLKHSPPDEPSAWAKILLPSGAHVWVNGMYVDTNKVVAVKKLNLRSGPGENYSVLGLLFRGEAITQVNSKQDWLEIEAPTNAYAFVAAQYLKPEAPEAPAVVAAVIPTPAPETTTTTPPPAEAPRVTTPPPETAAPAATPPTPAPVVATPAPTTPETPSPATVEAATPAKEQPLAPRIVQREGIVRGTGSIQAPTHFELISTDNGKTINYLHTPSPDLDLRRWKGLHIIVTGEEGLDERWRNTPVLTIQKIELLDEK